MATFRLSHSTIGFSKSQKVASFSALEAIIYAFEESYSTRVRFQASKKPTTRMAFASVQHCVSEYDTISVVGQIQCRTRGTPVRPTELTKSLAAVLSNIVKDKIEVHDLWLVGCYLHPQSISGMDRRREYRCEQNLWRMFFLLNQIRRMMYQQSRIIVHSTRSTKY